MTESNLWQPPKDVPSENFARGFSGLGEIPGLGLPRRGKVRDMYDDPENGRMFIVATDRQSAFEFHTNLTPGKGAILNQMSSFWFGQTGLLMPNHMIAEVHPNVMLVQKALAMLPIEWVYRNCLSESGSSTSVWKHYSEGKRNIYGIPFPDGLVANQFFPNGPIFTPTTKAASGHDQMITEDEARELVMDACQPFDSSGENIWDKTRQGLIQVFRYMNECCARRGLILADTKFEVGITQGPDGTFRPMLCDEVGTPDNSRLWSADSYLQMQQAGERPESFDKELLRRYLVEQGFTGEEGQTVPAIPQEVIERFAGAYRVPYEKLLNITSPRGEVDVDDMIMRIQESINF